MVLPCVAPSALPARFEEELRSQGVTEGEDAVLWCKLTKEASDKWREGQLVLQQGEKYTIKQEGSVSELKIHNPDVTDAGEYICMCGEQKTTSALTVHGKQYLENLEADTPPIVLASFVSSLSPVSSLLEPLQLAFGEQQNPVNPSPSSMHLLSVLCVSLSMESTFSSLLLSLDFMYVTDRTRGIPVCHVFPCLDTFL